METRTHGGMDACIHGHMETRHGRGDVDNGMETMNYYYYYVFLRYVVPRNQMQCLSCTVWMQNV